MLADWRPWRCSECARMSVKLRCRSTALRPPGAFTRQGSQVQSLYHPPNEKPLVTRRGAFFLFRVRCHARIRTPRERGEGGNGAPHSQEGPGGPKPERWGLPPRGVP